MALADEAVHIGAAPSRESYLQADRIIAACKQTGAQAVHPGYGFLSENEAFARKVEEEGITFIGPKAASMRKMGSKAGAKDLMSAHGVPVVPGYTGEDQDAALLDETASCIARVRAAAEAAEGITAFLDHRPPAWQPPGRA